MKQESQQTVSQGRASNQSSQMLKGGFKLFNIPLDLIPLNWCKMPQTKHIFEILALCFGPYNTSGTIDIDTSEIFDKIHNLARAAYAQSFNNNIGDEYNQNKYNFWESRLAKKFVSRQRMRSVVLNNQATQIYLNLADIDSGFIKNIKMNKIEELLNEACEISPQNQVALLNKHLLAWKQGKIRDDEFQLLNTT